jgi:flagella basal body P-ring formation protein FlgA
MSHASFDSSKILAALGIVLMMAAGGLADTIALRDHARVFGSVITLADIAALRGPNAEALAQVEIAKFPESQQQLSVSRRQVLDALRRESVHMGLVSCSGSMRIEIIRLAEPRHQAPADESSEAVDNIARANPVAPLIEPVDADDVSIAGESLTLRDRMRQWIEQSLDADYQAINIALIDETSPQWGLSERQGRFEIEPLSRDLLGRVPIVVRQYRGDDLLHTVHVQVEVQIMRSVVVATRRILRGQTFTDADVTLTSRWLTSLAQTPMTDPQQMVGQVADRLISADAIVMQGDARPPCLVERGQMMIVRCISGNLVIRSEARALEDGVDGQLIQVRNDRTRATFSVRVSGPQEGVMVVNRTAPVASAEENHGGDL